MTTAEQGTEQPTEQGVSEARAVTLAEAARLSGRSVQALRQRIARGSLTGCEVQSGGATVAGIELHELVRAFGQLSEPDELPQVDIPRPARAEQAPEQVSEQGGASAEQPRERAEQRAEQRPEQPPERDAPAGGAVAVVDALVQGWSEARNALVQLREEHASTLERVERQRVDAVRWGRAGVFGLVAVLAGAAVLVVQERDRAHAAAASALAEVSAVKVESSRELGQLDERARALETERDAARALAESRERTARAVGEAFGRVLRGGG